MKVGVGSTRVLTVGLMFLAATCYSLAHDAPASPQENDFVPSRVGQTLPAELVPAMPSAKFARHMLGHPAVVELKPGVIATKVPQFDHPHAIFATWDGFEAFAICAKRETVGCDVTFFDFAAQAISRYHMPLEFAEKRETYSRMIGK